MFRIIRRAAVRAPDPDACVDLYLMFKSAHGVEYLHRGGLFEALDTGVDVDSACRAEEVGEVGHD